MNRDQVALRAKLIERCADSYRRGDQLRWLACVDAARLVYGETAGPWDTSKPLYDKGAAIELAQRIRRTVRTVYNLAHAGDLYLHLHRLWPVPVDRLMDVLPYTFFVVMWELKARYNLDDEEVLDYLSDAADTEGVTVEALRGKVEAECGHGDGKPLQLDSRKMVASDAVYQATGHSPRITLIGSVVDYVAHGDRTSAVVEMEQGDGDDDGLNRLPIGSQVAVVLLRLPEKTTVRR